MPEWLREWWPVMAVAVPLALTAIAWAIRVGLASAKDLAAVDAAWKSGLDEERRARRAGSEDHRRIHESLGGRVAVLEQEVRNLPTREDLHEIAVSIERLSGDLRATNVKLDGLGTLMERTETTLQRHESIFTDAARAGGR